MAAKPESNLSNLKADESNSLLIPTIMLPSLEKPPPPIPNNVYTSENMTIIDLDHQVSYKIKNINYMLNMGLSKGKIIV